MRTTTGDLKSRQKLTAENMSEAQRVHHQLRSGAVRSELRNAREAVQIAGAFYHQAAELMNARKLDTKDLFVHISYLSPDLTVLSTMAFEPGKESQLYEKLSAGCSIMAGLIFAIRDKERESILVGAKPFVDTPLVREALKQRVEASGIGVN